jgi:hypothetical protein
MRAKVFSAARNAFEDLRPKPKADLRIDVRQEMQRELADGRARNYDQLFPIQRSRNKLLTVR